jgi:prephenate dehydrogenase
MGSSLGLALLEELPDLDLRIWARRPGAARQAAHLLRSQGARHCLGTTSLERAVRQAEVVVFCTPVSAMPALARSLRPFLSPTAAITDVGSVKAAIVSQMEKILGSHFVGAHPMAGSERSGLEAGCATLYRNATCILTPTETTDPAALRAITTLWLRAGCSLIFSTPEDHDAAVARVSHLPHLLSSLLVAQLRQATGEHELFAGPGFRDMTRLAAGPSSMWTEILRDNRTEVLAALDEFSRQINEARTALAAPRPTALLNLLEKARQHRHSLYP